MTTKASRAVTVLRLALPILITILWLGFIYSNSLKSGEQSGEQSGKVHEIVNEVADSVGYDKPISERFVRKSAHFTEFAILGGLICLDLWAFGVISINKKLYISAPLALISIPVSALFASIDELLQFIKPNRGPSIADVLLDTSGATVSTLCFIAFFTVFYLIFHSIKAKSSLHKNKSMI